MKNNTISEEEQIEDNRKELLLWVKDILIAVLVAIIIMQFIKPTLVKESSMEPNFIENDYLFVNRQSYKLLGGNPERGDVIVFKSHLTDSNGNQKLLIKRVIGVPGDVINIKDGEVFINDKQIDDDYTKERYTNGNIEDLRVPKDKYFCMGDNRTVSIDSRFPEVGFVDKDQIVGKVVFRAFPFKKAGTIKNPYE